VIRIVNHKEGIVNLSNLGKDNMNRLSLEQRTRILACLVEGNSLRATTRMVGVSINTVTKLLVDLGTACALYQNEALRNLNCKRIQCDEIWSFCYKKQKNVHPWEKGTLGQGDIYTWTAIDPDTKPVPSWLVGQRSAFYAKKFINDLKGRLDLWDLCDERFEIDAIVAKAVAR